MMRIFACSLGLEVEELLTARGREPRLLRPEHILFQHYVHYNLFAPYLFLYPNQIVFSDEHALFINNFYTIQKPN
jgi:hypothetical protein